MGTETVVDRRYDPVVRTLAGILKAGEVHEDGRGGRVVSALGIDLVTKNRIELSGNILSGALGTLESMAKISEDATPQTQVIIAIRISLGRYTFLCPRNLGANMR